MAARMLYALQAGTASTLRPQFETSAQFEAAYLAADELRKTQHVAIIAGTEYQIIHHPAKWIRRVR